MERCRLKKGLQPLPGIAGTGRLLPAIDATTALVAYSVLVAFTSRPS